jgi:hypothetical protein
MGALPNTLPQSPRKQPTRATREQAKASCKPRDWQELDRATRAGTNYDATTGWAPLFGGFIADMLRLSSGAACWGLVILLLHNLGRQRKANEALPQETEPMLIPELAALCQVDERTINRELKYLADRKMAVVVRLANSRVVIRLLYRDWAKIEKSYRDWSAEQESKIHEARPDPKPTQDTYVLKPGHRSRSIPIAQDVHSLRVQWEGKTLDIAFHPVVESGELICRAWLPHEHEKPKTPIQPNQQDTRKSGHICPDTPANEGRQSPPKGLWKEKRKETLPTVIHPRAAELCLLFDPFLKTSCQRLLSTDPTALSAACAELGDLDHNWLVNGIVQRAAAPINSPKHCAHIVRDLRLSWERAGKVGDPPALKETRKKSKSFNESVHTEAERRFKRFGRVDL